MKERFTSLSPFLQVLALILVGVVSFILLSMFTALVIHFFYPEIPSYNFTRLATEHPIIFMLMNFVPFQLGFLLTPGMVYLYMNKNALDALHFRFNPSTIWAFSIFICTFFLLPFFSGINDWITNALGVYDFLMEQKLKSDELLIQIIGKKSSNEAYIMGLIVIGLITGIAEELFFRGFLFHHLLRHTNKLNLSVFGSALFFALLHFNYVQLLPLIAFGIVLALMYYVSKSIWPGVLMHSANNMLNVYWLRNDNFPDWMEYVWWEITIPSTLLLMGLIYLKQRISAD